MRTGIALALALSLSLPAVAIAEAPDPAQALLDAWLKAQNDGDFAAYEALYASRFTGVRRSGTRTVHLDRRGWMKDRGRMFKAPMKVGATKVVIAPAAGGALVLLTQSFESGNYKDVGPKQMILAPEEGKLRIAREEMLVSTLLDARPSLDGAQARLAWMVDGAVVIDTRPDPAWAKGPPRWGKEEMFHRVERDVDAGRLPEGVARWLGKPLRTFDADGRQCEAKVTGFRFLARFTPHFAYSQSWRRMPAPKALAEAWSVGRGGLLLLGVLDNDCRRGEWARLASQPTTTVTPALEAPKQLAEAADKELRKLPEYKAVLKEFRAAGGKGEAWANVKREALVIEVELPKPMKYLAVAAKGGEGCGGFLGELTVLWEVGGTAGKPTFKRLFVKDSFQPPRSAVDLDGDDKLELIYDGDFWGEPFLRGVETLDGQPRRDYDELRIPMLDCPC